MGSAELGYLLTALRQAPGRRVLSARSVPGHLVAALTAVGYSVTGLGVGTQPQDAGRADAVICLGGLGPGGDPAHLRLLRCARDRLAPGGMLIVSQRHPFRAAIGPAGAGFDPVSGTLADGNRLYTIPELRALLNRAGLRVERIDADFTQGAAPTLRTSEVQLVARPLPLPPGALAGASEPAGADGTAGMLDLRWAPDEADFLHPQPRALWQALLAEDDSGGAEAARHYPLDDPYGADRAAPVVSAHFQVPIEAPWLTFGAGAAALLCFLAGLGDAGTVLVPQATHPDLPAWCLARGCRLDTVPAESTPAALAAAVHARRPALIHLDRPAITGTLPSLGEVEMIATAAARAGAILSLDETYASYLPPGASAVALVHRLDNLLVTRSMSKGYCWGGLRIGYTVASPAMAGRVRELVPPLQASELAYRMALRLLAAGDVFARLRSRVSTNKRLLAGLLRGLGHEVIDGHPVLPWVLIPDPAGAVAGSLAARGVRGKTFHADPAGDPRTAALRLSVPLSAERLDACRSLLRHGELLAPQQHQGDHADGDGDDGPEQEGRAQPQGMRDDSARERAQ
jgi:histidinol-phosphate/aromatic aminotransferase/cobyric acid decarboxylase-like protein